MKFQLSGEGVSRETVPMVEMGNLVVGIGGLLSVAANENGIVTPSALYQLSGARRGVVIRASTAEETARVVNDAMAGEPCSVDMQRALRDVLARAKRIGKLARFDAKRSRFGPIVEPPKPISREDFVEVRGVVVGVADRDGQDSITVKCDTDERVSFFCPNGAAFFRQRISVLISLWRTIPDQEDGGGRGRAISTPTVLPPLTDDMDGVMAKIGEAMRARGEAVDVDRMLADLRASRS